MVLHGKGKFKHLGWLKACSVESIAVKGFSMKYERCGGHFIAFYSAISHSYCMKTPNAYGMLVVDVALPPGVVEEHITYNSREDLAFIPRFAKSYK